MTIEMKINDFQLEFAVESYFEKESLISVEKQGEECIVVLKSLPIVN